MNQDNREENDIVNQLLGEAIKDGYTIHINDYVAQFDKDKKVIYLLPKKETHNPETPEERKHRLSDMHPEMRPVKGYEGLYAVTEDGRWLKPSVASRSKSTKTTGGTGYHTVQLYKSKKMRVVTAHRLVAEAFIPNPDDLPQVNHKDMDKGNNKTSNLEWCDNSYNQKHRHMWPEVKKDKK